MRFLICLLLYFGFSIFLFRLLNLRILRLLRFWFSSLLFLVNFPPPPSMSSVDTENRQGYDSLTFFCFFLNVFHFWQFLHHSINLGDFFLDIICQLAYIFLYVAFTSGSKCFFLGLVENGFLSIQSMISSVFLCFSELFLVFLLLVYNCEVKCICFPRRPALLKPRKKYAMR